MQSNDYVRQLRRLTYRKRKLFCAYYNILAGCESEGWHPLGRGFIMPGHRLEELVLSSKSGVVASNDFLQYV